MNLAAFPSIFLATLATTATLPRHEMPLKPSPALSLSRSLVASSLRRISPMASAAAPSSAPAAENGAAKPAEQQPVQVGPLLSVPSRLLPIMSLRFGLASQAY